MVCAFVAGIFNRDVQQARDVGMTHADSICAVVVTYHPTPMVLRELLSRLQPQVGKVLVVDNTPAGDLKVDTVLAQAIDGIDSIEVTRLGENLGIAAALNVGIESARRQAFDYVLLSDQDSRPDQAMVRSLITVYDELVNQGILVGCTCPAFVDLVAGQSVPFQIQEPGRFFYSSCPAEQAIPWVEVLTAITSGSLVPMNAIDAVGGMREDLFIDNVDTEWCHRARAAGFRLFGVGNARLEHRLGEGSFRVWYMRWRWFNDCSPPRMYYRVRNFLFLCRQSYVPLRWKIRTGWNWIGNVYAYCVYSPQRWQHLRWMAKGVVDAMRGRLGSI